MNLILIQKREEQPQDQEQQQEEEEDQIDFERAIVNQVKTRKSKLKMMPWMLNVSNYPERSAQRKTKI